jgi:hypothetical protein
MTASNYEHRQNRVLAWEELHEIRKMVAKRGVLLTPDV